MRLTATGSYRIFTGFPVMMPSLYHSFFLQETKNLRNRTVSQVFLSVCHWSFCVHSVMASSARLRISSQRAREL